MTKLVHYTSKEIRIAELEKQLEEVKREMPINYELVEVTPDCGGGIRDATEIIAISKDMKQLIAHCEDNFNYIPKLGWKRPNDGMTPCSKWYRLEYTITQIL